MADEPQDAGTGEVVETAVQPDQPLPIADAATATAVTEPSAEQFVNPAELPEELVPLYKRMQASFTKKMQSLSGERTGLRQKADGYDRLMNDPDYARQVIMEAAPRLGLSVAKQSGNGASAPAAAALQGDTSAPPADFVEAIKGRLKPEMQWMAEDLAQANWQATRMLMAPYMERQQQELRGRRTKDYESLADELSTKVPDWAEHEEDMAELLRFLASDTLTHPVYGSKIELLYNTVTKNSVATREAVKRMSNAGRSRTTTGRVETSTRSNLAEEVRKAPNMQDAWKLAAAAALQQVQGK